MSTLQEHLADLAKFKDQRFKQPSAWQGLIVNMVSAHLDELIALAAKEQPGEQNAEPAVIPPGDASALTVTPSQPQVSAPDMAAMVTRLCERAEYFGSGETALLLRQAAALIEKLRQGWIPVSERLPGEGIAVLTTDQDDLTVVGVWEGDHWRGRHWFEATHWMSLPPPPERP